MDMFELIEKYGWILLSIGFMGTALFWIFIVWVIIKLLQNFGVI